MSMRHTMKARRALTAVAIATGLVLTATGCGGDDSDKPNAGSSSAPTENGKQGEEDSKSEEPQASPAEETVLAEVQGGGDNATITINTAVREEGGFLTVAGKVKNGKGEFWNPAYWKGDESELSGNSSSLAGAYLVDKVGKKKYLILRDTDGRCLCTKFTGGFRKDEEKTWFAQFPAPPAGTTKVDFQIADMPPATIEISDGE